MNLLTFSRGPGMAFAVTVFLVGISLRLTALLLARRNRDLSSARPGSPGVVHAALDSIIRRSWASAPFRQQTMNAHLISYGFHLGLLLIVIGGTPHILFLKGLLGFAWPGLPKGVIDVISGLTLGCLWLALITRLTDPVRRRLSVADDYLTWLLTTLPVVTGLLATSDLGGRYENLLAAHLLSFELMLIWFPFGKLMHAILVPFSRATTGIRYAHRGARS